MPTPRCVRKRNRMDERDMNRPPSPYPSRLFTSAQLMTLHQAPM